MNIYVLKRLLEEGVKWRCGNGFDLLQETLENEYVSWETAEVWENQVGDFQLLKVIRTQNDYSNFDIRYIFMIDNCIYALDTHQDSFGSGQWNIEDFYEVEETTKIVTEWTPK